MSEAIREACLALALICVQVPGSGVVQISHPEADPNYGPESFEGFRVDDTRIRLVPLERPA
jgi:hypothetical protein